MLRAFVMAEFCLDASVRPSLIELSPGQSTVSAYSSTEVCVRRLNLRRLRENRKTNLLQFRGAPTSIETAHMNNIYFDPLSNGTPGALDCIWRVFPIHSYTYHEALCFIHTEVTRSVNYKHASKRWHGKKSLWTGCKSLIYHSALIIIS